MSIFAKIKSIIIVVFTALFALLLALLKLNKNELKKTKETLQSKKKELEVTKQMHQHNLKAKEFDTYAKIKTDEFEHQVDAFNKEMQDEKTDDSNTTTLCI